MNLSVLSSAAVAAALGGHFTLTLLYNVGLKPTAIVGRLEAFALLPKWHFFAPHPGIHNLYLLYRDVFPDGTVGNWTMLHGMDRFKSPSSCVWNPTKRLRKTLFDLITSLQMESEDEGRRHLIKLSAPYLLLIHHVSSIPRPTGAIATQFLIMQSHIDQPAHPIFTSELHPL
ncbi:hypothetical protein [Streptomyces torulosus]|uniref:hypothetical protein n=1 Tax=Streptomyces torulosus TaxID=68276 RepID=UPI0006EB3CEB|nr:hypothetical protein [Streptomyces torulosus]